MDAGGSFSYRAESGFVGIDTFTYQVIDVNGLSSETAVVQLIVAQNATKGKIAGPVVVPTNSRYTYSLQNARLRVTDRLQWTIEDRHKGAAIIGPNNTESVEIEYKGIAEVVRIKLQINNDQPIELSVAVVHVDLKPDFRFTPNRPASGPSKDVADGPANLQAIGNTPKNFVVRHDPGSNVAAFTFSGQVGMQEEAHQVDSQIGEAETLRADVTVTLSIPKGLTQTVFEYIQVGFIQYVQIEGEATFAGTKEKRQIYIAGEQGRINPAGPTALDWTPGRGVWPWYGAQLAITAPWIPGPNDRLRTVGDETVNEHAFRFVDSPNIVMPAFLDGVAAPNKNPLRTADVTRSFVTTISARTLNTSEGRADEQYFPIAVAPWSVEFKYDRTFGGNFTNVTTTPPGTWSTPGKTKALNVSQFPASLLSKAPFFTWVPPK